jgi:hypothetical protein
MPARHGEVRKRNLISPPGLDQRRADLHIRAGDVHAADQNEIGFQLAANLPPVNRREGRRLRLHDEHLQSVVEGPLLQELDAIEVLEPLPELLRHLFAELLIDPGAGSEGCHKNLRGRLRLQAKRRGKLQRGKKKEGDDRLQGPANRRAKIRSCRHSSYLRSVGVNLASLIL